ncbi:MAG: ATPase, partial [Eubacteriales bacterium]
MSGKIKKVFPGGNTSRGFYSYYDYMLEKGTNRIFVIKGGPGVGKSTLMKKIGNKMVELGYNTEFHYCSSDNNSLDGIVISQLGIVMVDGTAPHIVDPKYPGGVDEIINMGEFWDTEKMEENKEKIIASTTEVGRLFAKAYRFFAAARLIAENITLVHIQIRENYGVVNEKKLLEKNIFSELGESKILGNKRHLFGSAYTPEGLVDLAESILGEIGKVYFVEGELGAGKSELLEKIAELAIEKGSDVEIYHTPLIPEKIETIIIEKIGVGITVSKKFEDICYQKINLNKYLNRSILATYNEELSIDKELMDSLIQKGIEFIKKAKLEHDVLENYYVPNMDFKKTEDIYEYI